MPLTSSATSARAAVDPAEALDASATDAELRAAWAQLDRRLIACLGTGWMPVRAVRQHGHDIVARSRLYQVAVGIRDDGLAEIQVTLRPDLDAPLAERIEQTVGMAGAAIFERLARFMPVHVLHAASLPSDTLEVA